MSRPSKTLTSGKDYPGTWNQFLEWFHDEDSCLEYLEKLRWPDGFICPRCNATDDSYRLSRGRLMCRKCQYQSTVTAGTIFDKTRTPLRSWFAAAWYITNQKNGVSALGLQRMLGLGSYETAWTMLHRFRRAMVNTERERLSGIVEVDETYVGGRDVGKTRAPHPDSKKSIVIIAIEVQEPKGFGRIRLRRIADASKDSVESFICDSIEPGSIVQTDGSAAYRSIDKLGYTRNKIVQLGADEPAHVTLVGVHRIASLLKRWLMDTHQGSVNPEQLDCYLEEYTFRFNRRTSRSRGMLFFRLLEQSVATPPITYQKIAGLTQ